MKPYKCPVCEGRGTMPDYFYEIYPGYSTSTGENQVPCQSCSGTGIIYGGEKD